MKLLIVKFKKESTTVTKVVAVEALKLAPQLPSKYYKYTIYLVPFSFLSRLLSYIQIANYNKVYCEYYKEKFNSNNKLYKHLNIYFAIKPRKTTIKVASITISNADIAIKKEGIDCTTTIVVVEISLLASQLVIT